jgi:hypothetical protein
MPGKIFGQKLNNTICKKETQTNLTSITYNEKVRKLVKKIPLRGKEVLRREIQGLKVYPV